VEREDNLMWLDVAIRHDIKDGSLMLDRQKDWEICSSAKTCNVLISLAWYGLLPSLIEMEARPCFPVCAFVRNRWI